MKRTLLYSLLALVMAACSSDAPEIPGDGGDTYEMHFRAVTGVPSRATGIYKLRTYPVQDLYLTAFLIDQANVRQYYFVDKKLDYDTSTSFWKASDWYWPMQGEMCFLSYWCPGFSRQPGFDEIVDADDNNLPRMTVDATDLDGMTDFLYLSQREVYCPNIEAQTLCYNHGLTWLTITLSAEVFMADGITTDDDKTNTLIANLKVHKVIIEDCARKGIASIIPGVDINWKPYDDRVDPAVSYVMDQMYVNDDATKTSISEYSWTEITDASSQEITSYLPIGSSSLPRENKALGIYDVSDNTKYIGEGILIIPQNKTAITVDYTVTDIAGNDVHKVERYELRDNTLTWKPGYHYNYDIVFRNYNDYDHTFDVIESWEGVKSTLKGNLEYDSATEGWLHFKNGTGGATDILLEPLHSGGSGTGDDMDYPEGPRVF